MPEMLPAQKVPPFEILEMSNTDPRFYQLIGPLLSRREIVKELGGPIWDDDDKRWYIACSENEVHGIVALQKNTVCSLYVTPGRRGEVIGTTILFRLLQTTGDSLRAVATPMSVGLFERCGFTATKTKGSYTVMERKNA